MTYKIKAIIEIYNSRTDHYGNRYFAARVTSTRTGKSYTFDDDARKVESLVHDVLKRDWDSTFVCNQDMAIRDFNHWRKENAQDSKCDVKKLKAVFRK